MSQFAIKDAGNVLVKARSTGKPIFYTRTPNTFNFTLESETVYAKAKGSNAIAFDGAITATLTIEQEVVTFDQFTMILATDMTEGVQKITERYVGTLDGSKKVTIKNKTFVPNSVVVFALDADGVSNGKPLDASASQASANIEVTINEEDSKQGDKVAVFYMIELPATTKSITVKDVVNSQNYIVEADIAVKTAMGTNMVMYATFYNCKAQRAIELALDAENPTNFTTTMDVLPNEQGEYCTFAFVGDESGTSMASFAETYGLQIH